MIPALLTNAIVIDADADKAAGTGSRSYNGHSSNNNNNNNNSMAPLSQRMQATHDKVTELKEELEDTSISVSKVFGESNGLYNLTHECAIYPVKNIAARRQIDLPSDNTSANANANQLSETVKRLNAMLQENSTHVDRLEGMPSVYLWRMMEDLQKRIEGLYQKLGIMKKELGGRKDIVWREVERVSGSGGGGDSMNMDATEELSSAMQNQMHALVRVAGVVGRLNEMMEELRQAYKRQVAFERFQKGGMRAMNSSGQMNMNMGGAGYGAGVGIGFDNGMGFDPFLEADRKEYEEERRLNLEVRTRTIQAAANIPTMNALPAAPLTPAPASGGLFGNTPALAPVAGGGFFGSAPTPAPGGGLFGAKSPAPAGSAFGGFGSPTPGAPAAGGSLFGGTPAAPAAAGLFGASTPVAAPAAGGFSFGGSTPVAAPTTAGGFGGGFGSTPTLAPAAGGLFGAPAAAPAAGGMFGAPVPVAPAAGGMFGAPALVAPAAGGMFGAPAPVAPAAGGMFGAPAPAAPAAAKSRRRAGRRR